MRRESLILAMVILLTFSPALADTRDYTQVELADDMIFGDPNEHTGSVLCQTLANVFAYDEDGYYQEQTALPFWVLSTKLNFNTNEASCGFLRDEYRSLESNSIKSYIDITNTLLVPNQDKLIQFTDMGVTEYNHKEDCQGPRCGNDEPRDQMWGSFWLDNELVSPLRPSTDLVPDSDNYILAEAGICAESMSISFSTLTNSPNFPWEQFSANNYRRGYTWCRNTVFMDSHDFQGWKSSTSVQSLQFPIACSDIELEVYDAEPLIDLSDNPPPAWPTGSWSLNEQGGTEISQSLNGEPDTNSFIFTFTREGNIFRDYSISIDDTNYNTGGFNYRLNCIDPVSIHEQQNYCEDPEIGGVYNENAQGDNGEPLRCCTEQTVGQTSYSNGEDTFTCAPIISVEGITTYDFTKDPIACGADMQGLKLPGDHLDYCCEINSEFDGNPHLLGDTPVEGFPDAEDYFCSQDQEGRILQQQLFYENWRYQNLESALNWRECTQQTFEGDPVHGKYLCQEYSERIPSPQNRLIIQIETTYDWIECEEGLAGFQAPYLEYVNGDPYYCGTVEGGDDAEYFWSPTLDPFCYQEGQECDCEPGEYSIELGAGDPAGIEICWNGSYLEQSSSATATLKKVNDIPVIATLDGAQGTFYFCDERATVPFIQSHQGNGPDVVRAQFCQLAGPQEWTRTCGSANDEITWLLDTEPVDVLNTDEYWINVSAYDPNVDPYGPGNGEGALGVTCLDGSVEPLLNKTSYPDEGIPNQLTAGQAGRNQCHDHNLEGGEPVDPGAISTSEIPYLCTQFDLTDGTTVTQWRSYNSILAERMLEWAERQDDLVIINCGRDESGVNTPKSHAGYCELAVIDDNQVEEIIVGVAFSDYTEESGTIGESEFTEFVDEVKSIGAEGVENLPDSGPYSPAQIGNLGSVNLQGRLAFFTDADELVMGEQISFIQKVMDWLFGNQDNVLLENTATAERIFIILEDGEIIEQHAVEYLRDPQECGSGEFKKILSWVDGQTQETCYDLTEWRRTIQSWIGRDFSGGGFDFLS